MIRIHGSMQIPTTQVSQIKGLAVGLVRRYPLLREWILSSACENQPELSRERPLAISNKAHGEDFDLAHAVNLSHFRFESVCKTFTVVHLDVDLDEFETEGQRLGLDGLNIVVVVSEGSDRRRDGVRVNVFETGIGVHFVCHHYHAHAITSGTDESAVRALVQHALVSNSGASTNGEEASWAGESG